MCRVPILSGHPEFGGFSSFFGSDEGVGRGLARNGPKGPKHYKSRHSCHCLGSSPSSSYSGWSGAYSIGTPCIYVISCPTSMPDTELAENAACPNMHILSDFHMQNRSVLATQLPQLQSLPLVVASKLQF